MENKWKVNYFFIGVSDVSRHFVSAALRLVVGTDVQHMAVARRLIIFYVLVFTLLVSFTGR